MKIYLSYASERRQVAEPIALSMRSRGYDVFFDRDDLPPGKSFDERIEKAMADADLLVFLISPEAVSPGRYTLTEVEFAKRKWRRADSCVLPVMIVPTDLSLVPAFLKSVNMLTPAGNAAAEVSSAVAAMVRPPVAGRIVPTAIAIGLITGALSAFVILPIDNIPGQPDLDLYVINYGNLAPIGAPLYFALGLSLLLWIFERPPVFRFIFLAAAVFLGWLLAINIFLQIGSLDFGQGEIPSLDKINAVMLFATGATAGAVGGLSTWIGAVAVVGRLFRVEALVMAVVVGALAGCLLYPSWVPDATQPMWILFCGWQAAVAGILAWLLSRIQR